MRQAWMLLAAAAVAGLTASAAQAGEAKRSTFGRTGDGKAVPAVTLTNSHGVSATVIAWGASLQALRMPDRDGRVEDVILGYPDMTRGFDKVVWDVVSVKSGNTPSVTLRYVSRDGDQGYPGTLTVDATYSLDENNALTIDYRATTDRPTVVNLSNHAYWNLSGEGSRNGAMGHILEIPAQRFTPVDETLIPTGELRPVAGTVFDFRTPHEIGERVRDARDIQMVYGRGYDHNWVIGDRVTPDQHLMARVHDPLSGRGFELWSNQPGLQFYSGNFINGTVTGKAQRIYRGGDAIVLEPQLFPDTVNQPAFGSARLDPGQTYRNTISFRLATGQTTPPQQR
jgi:aldose 1-epimerase